MDDNVRQSSRVNTFQALEKTSLKVPIIGNRLTEPTLHFPDIGKIRAHLRDLRIEFSNHWKGGA